MVAAGWAPDRQEVIWIDCNPQAGREMRDVHPLLVLSPRAFNERTSLVIGLPINYGDSLLNALFLPYCSPMARLARIVAPEHPHHVTQRGNRRERTFLFRKLSP